MKTLSTAEIVRELERGAGPARPQLVRDHVLRSVAAGQQAVREQRPDPPTEDWIAGRTQALAACLGVDAVPLCAQPTDVLVRELEGDGFVVEKRVVEVLDGLPLPVDVYRPDAGGPWPLVLHAPGHWLENGRLHADFQRNAITLARAGIVTAVHDPIDQGERFTGWGAHGELALVAVGISMVGLLLAEARALVRLLALRADVDAQRIGVTGASGGGQIAMYLPLVEPLIAVTVPVCYANTLERMVETFVSLDYFGGVDLCSQIPRLADELTLADVIGFAAPTPACYINALDDPNFPIAGAREVVAEAARYYHTAGAPGSLRLVEVPGGHGYDREATEAACEFICNAFRLDPRVTPAVSESDLQSVPYAVDFMTAAELSGGHDVHQDLAPTWDPTTCVLPSPVNCGAVIADLARRIATETAPCDDLAPAFIKESFGLYEPDSTCPARIEQTWHLGALRVERILVESEPGITLPILLCVPAEYDHAIPVLLALSRRGALHALEAIDVAGVVAAGWAVCACEARGFGETRGVEFALATTALLNRKHLFAQRACDLWSAIDYLMSRAVVGVQLDRRRVVLAAADAETGLLARAAAACDERVSAVWADEQFTSWADILDAEANAQPWVYVPEAARRLRLQDLASAARSRRLSGAADPTGAHDRGTAPSLLAWLKAAGPRHNRPPVAPFRVGHGNDE
jgi:hypothetical protein